MFNANGDEYLTVYELAQCLNETVPGKTGAIEYARKAIVDSERDFLKNVTFKVLNIDEDMEDLDNIIKSTQTEGVCTVKPFHRPLIVAELPLFDEELLSIFKSP